MNIKTFTIIAIASFAVLSVTACGGKQKASIETEQTEETSKTEVIVSDNKLFINSDLYNMSEEKVIFNAHGRLDPDNPSFGTDHIELRQREESPCKPGRLSIFTMTYV